MFGASRMSVHGASANARQGARERGPSSRLPPAETELRFVDEVGAKDGDVLLETGQHGLADTKRLDGLLIRTGEKMLIVWRGWGEEVAKNMGKCELHGFDPFQMRSA